MSNIFDLSGLFGQEEYFESLLENRQTVVERIVSHGQITPPGLWYQQPWDEWVCILQGEAELLIYPQEICALHRGGHYLIPAQQKHRVTMTSSPCIWLAIHWVSAVVKSQTSVLVSDEGQGLSNATAWL